MNFLQLCQRTASECGVSLTGPSAVTGQVGRLGQIVKWVALADMDIQTLHNDWHFMRSAFTVSATSGDGKYAATDCTDTGTSSAISKFRDWCRDTPMKVYLTSAGVGGETDMCYLRYEDWYSRYNVGTQTNGKPFFWSVHPDRSLLLAPKPDATYTVSGDYMKSATEMTADASEPLIPSDYHMAIVYRAMMKYGRYAGASEVFNDGQAEYRRVLNEMRRTQRPEIQVPGALA